MSVCARFAPETSKNHIFVPFHYCSFLLNCSAMMISHHFGGSTGTTVLWRPRGIQQAAHMRWYMMIHPYKHDANGERKAWPKWCSVHPVQAASPSFYTGDQRPRDIRRAPCLINLWYSKSLVVHYGFETTGLQKPRRRGDSAAWDTHLATSAGGAKVFMLAWQRGSMLWPELGERCLMMMMMMMMMMMILVC